MLRRIVTTGALISSIALLVMYRYWLDYLQQPLNIADEALIYEVQKGSSLNGTLRDLSKKGVLNQPVLLIVYAKIFNRGHSIHAGEYRLETTMTPLSLLDVLEQGKVLHYFLTLPEGWNYRQVIAALHEQTGLRQTITDLSPESVVSVLDWQGDVRHPEGMFFPDTYQFQKGMSDVDVLNKAHGNMMSILEEEWARRGSNLPLKSPYEALILASIVEKETSVGSERARIAGVFIRRLKKNMRLQTDPTVIYGLGDAYRRNLTRKHLHQYTPYNTYMIKELPPTPIAIPGRAAIHAVLHPAGGNSLYFVAKGDGSHHFSDTIEAHNSAVRRYQKINRAKNYRSTPEQATQAP